MVGWSTLRPRRTLRAPVTYWDEFVAKDPWYVKKLTEDVPEEEMHAALVCEEFGSNEGEEGDSAASVGEEEEEEVSDVIEEGTPPNEDEEYVPHSSDSTTSTVTTLDASNSDSAADSEVLGSSEGDC